MIELIMLMIGAAVLIAVVNRDFVQPFLRHEARRVGWADEVHRHVGHAVCLEDLPALQAPGGFEKYPITYVAGGKPICAAP